MHGTVRAHAGLALAVPLLLPVLMLAALPYMPQRLGCRLHAAVRAHAGPALAVPLPLPVLMLAALSYM